MLVVAAVVACSSSPSVRLSGQVVDLGTGTPIHGARVQFAGVRSSSVPEAVTDNDGRFTMVVADPARGDVVAAKEGYVALGVGGVGVRDENTLRIALRRQGPEDQAAGDFFGVGVSLDFTGGRPVVAEVRTLGALLAGDVVVRVDGSDTQLLRPVEIAGLFRGNDGTTCVVEVLRGTGTLSFEVKRSRQTGPAWML
ncbi:MAG: carboxypeptidase regulatory-like domain-containing protein [Deltaproteobacteria bacterium]|nr:carboxypeptidase regulatory-like domain-containing protein [Deltaproteobacteria bacterium]